MKIRIHLFAALALLFLVTGRTCFAQNPTDPEVSDSQTTIKVSGTVVVDDQEKKALEARVAAAEDEAQKAQSDAAAARVDTAQARAQASMARNRAAAAAASAASARQALAANRKTQPVHPATTTSPVQVSPDPALSHSVAGAGEGEDMNNPSLTNWGWLGYPQAAVIVVAIGLLIWWQYFKVEHRPTAPHPRSGHTPEEEDAYVDIQRKTYDHIVGPIGSTAPARPGGMRITATGPKEKGGRWHSEMTTR